MKFLSLVLLPSLFFSASTANQNPSTTFPCTVHYIEVGYKFGVCASQVNGPPAPSGEFSGVTDGKFRVESLFILLTGFRL